MLILRVECIVPLVHIPVQVCLSIKRLWGHFFGGFETLNMRMLRIYLICLGLFSFARSLIEIYKYIEIPGRIV